MFVFLQLTPSDEPVVDLDLDLDRHGKVKKFKNEAQRLHFENLSVA